MGLAVFAEHNRIGFHVFGHIPSEEQIVPLLFGRLALRHNRAVFAGQHMDVRGLYQQTAAHAFDFEAVRAFAQRHFQHAHVFLGF